MNCGAYMEGSIKRVAAYCRVSTDKSDQANSFSAQKNYFYDYINSRLSWQFSGIFCDEGVTGTSTKKRAGFMNMISTAEKGEIDIIVTKEISRFARNTLDSIYYTRALRRLGVGVIFINDGINTLDSDGELRLTIMASVAQEESRKTSERVRWGQRRQMENGVVFGSSLLGYRLNGGKLAVQEDEAELVRMIFRLYCQDGLGAYAIAKRLEDCGIKMYNGGEKWQASAVLRILKNEKYCGDLIQQKTYTADYLTHEKKKNRGELELVVKRDHHEAIINRETFEQAQRLMAERSKEGKRCGVRYGFSGKLKCGICGKGYTSKYKNNKNGAYRLWRCNCDCKARSIKDIILREKLKNELSFLDADTVSKNVCKAIQNNGTVIDENAVKEMICGRWGDRIIRSVVKNIYMNNGDAEFVFNL
ncbi:MAG: recombinase family protein [Clostridia bacterium]|nr:recombinase family protein [Clostridia bacterium]